MATITFHIQDAKLARITTAIAAQHEIPKDDQGQPLFTQNAWAKEYLRRLVVREVFSYEREQDGKTVTMDDSIIS